MCNENGGHAGLEIQIAMYLERRSVDETVLHCVLSFGCASGSQDRGDFCAYG